MKTIDDFCFLEGYGERGEKKIQVKSVDADDDENFIFYFGGGGWIVECGSCSIYAFCLAVVALMRTKSMILKLRQG